MAGFRVYLLVQEGALGCPLLPYVLLAWGCMPPSTAQAPSDTTEQGTGGVRGFLVLPTPKWMCFVVVCDGGCRYAVGVPLPDAAPFMARWAQGLVGFMHV